MAIPSARAVASCAVHVKIHPRPQSIAESTQILRELQRFGEVGVFKHLKYEPNAPAPNTALAIYKRPESAQRALTANLVSFHYGGQHSTSASPISSPSSHSASTTTPPQSRPCTLAIRPSALSHLSYIARQAYYDNFGVEPSHAPGAALLGPLPRGLRGLGSFEFGKEECSVEARRVRAQRREREGRGMVGLLGRVRAGR